MSPRVRVFSLVGLAAAVAAAVVVGVSAFGAGSRSAPAAAAAAPARPHGAPTLALDLGLRQDAEAAALRRAARLYGAGDLAGARAIFARYASLNAHVGLALARWPHGTLARLDALAASHPRSALVQLHRGLALGWEGRPKQAAVALRAAERLEPDTQSAIEAGDLLHPRAPPGLPQFVPGFGPPAALLRLSPERELAVLARAAARASVKDKLLYGVALQRTDHPISAERQFAAAAALAPDDPEAQVAAAVGRFDKDRPAAAFSRLGPLSRRFPHAATVRFHLGLLLLWIQQVAQAKREFTLARADAPASPLGRESAQFLARLGALK